MITKHLELLVEEPSMEAFPRGLLPRIFPVGCSFDIRTFQGKPDLLSNLDNRLKSYAQWLPDDWRLLVMVDRDNDDCPAAQAADGKPRVGSESAYAVASGGPALAIGQYIEEPEE